MTRRMRAGFHVLRQEQRAGDTRKIIVTSSLLSLSLASFADPRFARRLSLRLPTALLVSPMMRACLKAERDVSDEKCPQSTAVVALSLHLYQLSICSFPD